MTDHHATLRDDLLRKLQAIVPPGQPVVFFDYAVYRNVGDLLISRSVERFFELNGNRVIDRFCMQNHQAAIGRKFPQDAILVFQGGGNFGDLFGGHQEIRMKLLLAHPGSRAVVLPQTIFYKSPENLKRDAKLLNGLPHLTLCLRDQVSYDIAAENFTSARHLLPDTVHLLQDFFGSRPLGDRPLKFLRLDQGSYSVTGLDILPGSRDDFMDWPKFLSPLDVKVINRFQQVHAWDARFGHTGLPYAAWSVYRGRLLRRAADLFLGSGSVVTNRLHGLILGLICRRPVTIIESGYGKVSAYYDTFLSKFDSVTLANPGVHEKGMGHVLRQGSESLPA